MAKDKTQTPEQKRALEIYRELMPKAVGSVILFTGIKKHAIINMEKIYKIILKAVKESAK